MTSSSGQRKPPNQQLYRRINSSSASSSTAALFHPTTTALFAAVFLLYVSFFLVVVVKADVPDEEREALLTLIRNIKHNSDYSWDKLHNESKPVCDDKDQSKNWKGVECDAGCNFVIYLRMPAASLIGEIPQGTIGVLQNLRVLSLHYNRLNGTLPSDLSNLANLKTLALTLNEFSGNLPDLQNSPLLEDVYVAYNNFSGEIPQSLSKFDTSVFAGNKHLCGHPLPTLCPNKTSGSPPHPPSSQTAEEGSQAAEETPPPSSSPPNENNTKHKDLILGVSVGSGLLLLLLFCCVGKKINKQQSQDLLLPLHQNSPSSAASGLTPGSTTTVGGGGGGGDESNGKLVLLDNARRGGYDFDMEDLFAASKEVLGKGSVGRSLKVQLMNTGGGMAATTTTTMTVVVKRLKDNHLVVTKDEFEATMKVLGKMKSKHLVPLLAYYYSEDEILLVYDYLPAAGSLSALLHGRRYFGQTRLNWNQRTRIALSAARGVEHLHKTNIVHGNIKSSNILLQQETNKDVASVSDYGLGTLFDRLTSQNHPVTGYQAPEVFTTQKFTFESDVYSFGVLLLELLTGKDPNQVSSGTELIGFSMWVQSIIHGKPNAEIFDVELTSHQNNEENLVWLFQIAKDCVLFEPDHRPIMQKVVSMMENMDNVEMDDWLRQSSDDHSKAFDDTPSTETRDTPSTITP